MDTGSTNLKHISYPKIPRIEKMFEYATIVEKIDGTNASIYIDDSGKIKKVGSRNRWITPEDDNYGFAAWVKNNEKELEKLGAGIHFGEWYGSGIQRNYGLKEKRFALFNYYTRTEENTPLCCSVLRPLYEGEFSKEVVDTITEDLKKNGSVEVPGFMNPEGIIIHLPNIKQMLKWTFEKPKWVKKDDV